MQSVCWAESTGEMLRTRWPGISLPTKKCPLDKTDFAHSNLTLPLPPISHPSIYLRSYASPRAITIICFQAPSICHYAQGHLRSVRFEEEAWEVGKAVPAHFSKASFWKLGQGNKGSGWRKLGASWTLSTSLGGQLADTLQYGTESQNWSLAMPYSLLNIYTITLMHSHGGVFIRNP